MHHLGYRRNSVPVLHQRRATALQVDQHLPTRTGTVDQCVGSQSCGRRSHERMCELAYLLRSGVFWLPLTRQELRWSFIAKEGAYPIEPAPDANVVVGTG